MDEKERLDRYNEYVDLTDDEFNLEYKYILDYWEAFLKVNDPQLLASVKYHIHNRNIFEIIRRVDKRKVYYKVFHKLDAISEYKRTALVCYWIITLKPFFVFDENSPLYNSPNELFALYLILATIRSAYGKICKLDPDFAKTNSLGFSYPSEERMGDIVYNFKYTDISREAMINFVETFADNWGIGISYVLKNSKILGSLIYSSYDEDND